MQCSIDVAAAIHDMTTEAGRLRAYRDLVDAAWRLEGISRTAALQLNAEVTTLLRRWRVSPFTAVLELA